MLGTALVQKCEREAEILARQARVLGQRSRILNRAATIVSEAADRSRIEALRAEVAPIYATDPFCAAKYPNFRHWLWRNIDRAGQMGLHTSPPLRILDIGAGPGYFIATARALGHDCHGLDLPEPQLIPVEQRVYRVMLESLGCYHLVSRHRIEPFVPLPQSRRFDRITAFLVCFNFGPADSVWGIPEWRFFVDDVRNHLLRDGGSLFLNLNDSPQHYGDLLFYDRPLLEYFRSIGSVNGSRITIMKDDCLVPDADENQERSQ